MYRRRYGPASSRISKRPFPYKTSKPASTAKSKTSKPSDSQKATPTKTAAKSRTTPDAQALATGEKRQRRFRPHPPQSFTAVYERALSQRFFVLNRTRCGTEECPQEEVEMAGSTGNVYTVVVGPQPGCDCPHAKAGNQCKHVVYVLSRVLNAPYELVYQLALLSSELRTIFANAPPIASRSITSDTRKPVEGDCPICYCGFEGARDDEIVWCRAACGQNVHRECFRMWARAKKGGATCPFCRAAWEADGTVRREEGVVAEGYVNVADQLGMSRVRDDSSYSPWFWRRQGMPRW